MNNYIREILFKIFYREFYRGEYNIYYKNIITGDIRIRPS